MFFPKLKSLAKIRKLGFLCIKSYIEFPNVVRNCKIPIKLYLQYWWNLFEKISNNSIQVPSSYGTDVLMIIMDLKNQYITKFNNEAMKRNIVIISRYKFYYIILLIVGFDSG